MGKTISSLIAEIFMHEKESTSVDVHLERPNVWESHADDVFAIIKRDSIQSFYKHISFVHAGFKFTTEIEKEYKLAFLDTDVQRHASKCLIVLVYRKPSHTDEYLNAV